jgi:hypothetical protein
MLAATKAANAAYLNRASARPMVCTVLVRKPQVNGMNDRHWIDCPRLLAHSNAEIKWWDMVPLSGTE